MKPGSAFSFPKAMGLLFAAIGFTTVIAAVISAPRLCLGAEKTGYPFRPAPFADVRIADAFWTPRLEVDRTVTVPLVFRKFEETGWIDHFAKAAGTMEGGYVAPVWFTDSEVFKAVASAACWLAVRPDRKLEGYLDGLIAKIAAAQRPSGYLNTYHILKHRRAWADVHKNELFQAGVLIEAGVTYFQATGKRSLLDVAIRYADHIDDTFGPQPGKKKDPPDHQQIELALVRLSRITGKKRYLRLARFFLEQRGRTNGRKIFTIADGPKYFQDHKPVVEQDKMVGHTVRGLFTYCGMADVAAEGMGPGYVDALRKIWRDVVSTKLLVHGGLGVVGAWESVVGDYNLPNDKPDVDTCTPMALAFWAQRMNLMQPDGQYGDVLERALYNRLLAGVSLDGTRFAHGLPMNSRGPQTYYGGGGPLGTNRHYRKDWFTCPCCPPHWPRLLATLGSYIYTLGDDELYVNLYIAGRARLSVAGSKVEIVQHTRYPWDGAVKIVVNPTKPAEFTVNLRIPGWARGRPVPSDLYRYAGRGHGPIGLKLNDKPVTLEEEKGFARIRRRWKPGDVVELNLPMPIRRVYAHRKVEADRGRVALERGPLVYCLEGIDNEGQVHNIVLPPDAKLATRRRDDLLGGIVVIRGTAQRRVRTGDGIALRPAEITAVPYYAFDNRQPGPVMVWLAEIPDILEGRVRKAE